MIAALPLQAQDGLRAIVVAYPEGLVNVASTLLDLAQLQSHGLDVHSFVGVAPVASAHPGFHVAIPSLATPMPPAKRVRVMDQQLMTAVQAPVDVPSWCAANGCDDRVVSTLLAEEEGLVQEVLASVQIGPNCRSPSAVVITRLKEVRRERKGHLPTAVPSAPAGIVHIPVAQPQGRGAGRGRSLHPVAAHPAMDEDPAGAFAAQHGLDEGTVTLLRSLPTEGVEEVIQKGCGAHVRNPNAVVVSNCNKWKKNNGAAMD